MWRRCQQLAARPPPIPAAAHGEEPCGLAALGSRLDLSANELLAPGSSSQEHAFSELLCSAALVHRTAVLIAAQIYASDEACGTLD